MATVSEAAFDSIRDRVSVLEREIAVAAESQRNIIARLERIDSNLSRIMWLIISAIVASAAGFMLKGGLFGPIPPLT